MKIQTFETKEDWFEARKGKITGSRLKDVLAKRGTGKKIGYYELIAEKLALSEEYEDPIERGNRLEKEAIECFEKETGKKVDTSLVIWTSDENEDIALSPDGFIDDQEAVEVKCLATSRHIETLLTNKLPNEYKEQALQYFIVNEKLQTLYFVMYDPRLTVKSFFYFTIKREELQKQIDSTLTHQKEVLEEINQIVSELSF